MPFHDRDKNSNEASDMPANSLPSSDDARYAALATEVRGLDSDYKELKGIVVGLDRKIEANAAALSSKMELMVNGLGNKFEASVTSIQAKLDERSQIPWQAWSVTATVIIAIGALVYWPIREQQQDMREVIREMSRQVQDVRERSAKYEQSGKNLEARYDAISRRLAEVIRDVYRVAK